MPVVQSPLMHAAMPPIIVAKPKKVVFQFLGFLSFSSPLLSVQVKDQVSFLAWLIGRYVRRVCAAYLPGPLLCC